MASRALVILKTITYLAVLRDSITYARAQTENAMTDHSNFPDEKDREKNREKTLEKGRGDPVSAIAWAAILIWAGLVLLADNLGYLANLNLGAWISSEWLVGAIGVWSLILIGAGIILLLEVLVRLLFPAYRRGVTGTIILAFLFIGLGLGSLVSWGVILPLMLIAIGLVIVIRVLFRR